MSTEFRAAVVHEANGPLSLERIRSVDPKPGDVLVRIVATGVCGSDVHGLNGEGIVPFPLILGHEASGVVEEIGAAVTTVGAGDHVVLGWQPGCGRCATCWDGQPRLCPNNRADGFLADHEPRLFLDGEPAHVFGHIGSFAEYALVTERTCVKIREDAPLEKMCLIGCAVTTGFGAVFHRAGVLPGSSAVVVGCGGVGLGVVQALDLAAATTIVAVDVNPFKLDAARAFGATHVVEASGVDPVEAVRELTRGRGADFAFEVISTPTTIRQAWEMTRAGGTVTVVGISGLGEEMSLPARSNKIVQPGGPVGTQWTVTPKLVDLYMAGRLRVDELITRTRPLAEANEAFADLRAGTVTRTVLLP